VLLKLAIDTIISGFTGLIAFLSKNCVKYTKAFFAIIAAYCVLCVTALNLV